MSQIVEKWCWGGCFIVHTAEDFCWNSCWLFSQNSLIILVWKTYWRKSWWAILLPYICKTNTQNIVTVPLQLATSYRYLQLAILYSLHFNNSGKNKPWHYAPKQIEFFSSKVPLNYVIYYISFYISYKHLLIQRLKSLDVSESFYQYLDMMSVFVFFKN